MSDFDPNLFAGSFALGALSYGLFITLALWLYNRNHPDGLA